MRGRVLTNVGLTLTTLFRRAQGTCHVERQLFCYLLLAISPRVSIRSQLRKHHDAFGVYERGRNEPRGKTECIDAEASIISGGRDVWPRRVSISAESGKENLSLSLVISNLLIRKMKLIFSVHKFNQQLQLRDTLLQRKWDRERGYNPRGEPTNECKL